MSIILTEALFLKDSDNMQARLIKIADAAGSIQCVITNYGARLVSCIVPDEKGDATDVVLGYKTLTEYAQQPEDYMGAIVGRCANRIRDGRFHIDGIEYHTTQNEGLHTLHGGHIGLHAKVWTVVAQTQESVTLGLLSADGDEGFPGNLRIEVTYKVAARSELTISYHAITDAPTLVNISNHAYWNLSGEGSATIQDHYLQINGTVYTPVDESLLPNGEIISVQGTPFDFRSDKMIGAGIGISNTQLEYGKGYDHNWRLDVCDEAAAVLKSPHSGITMNLFTTMPGLQFYSGNGLDGTSIGKRGKMYGYRSAVVLEPQNFPDSIHHSNFPAVILLPTDVYARTDKYIFT